ncbi:hypothetical protein [uncultured Paraglaciecola sp.]|uniref:hypothetical protein n=1 Tax=uncultured Paraglaciecola sp. TaxID=1765024 RepID=UPI0030D820EF
MKILLSVTTIITLAAGSALLSAQADESVFNANTATTMPILPAELQQLEAKLTETQYDMTDRNTKLRVERAVHYFGMARKHADSGWSKMASDQAARGLSLLELDNMQYMQSSDAQM